MKKSITKNYMYNVCYQVMALLTPLITTPYIARVLEPEGVGIYSYTGNVNAYFTFIAALGTAKYGLREIAYVSDDRNKRTKVFWEVEFLSCIAVIISLVLYIVFLFFQKEKFIYVILSINILSVAFEISWFFQGIEDFGKVTLRNCVIKLLYVAYVFLFVKEKSDLIIYILGLPLLTFVSNASLWFSLSKYVDPPKIKMYNLLKHLKGTFSLFIPTMAIQIYSAIDIIMIKVLTSSYVENGYYEQALKLSKMVLMIVTSMSIVMLPRVANYYKQKKYDEMKNCMYKTYRFLWMIGIPLAFGLAGIASNIVPWFFGQGYDKVVDLLQIMSFLIIAMGMSIITGNQYLVSINKQKEYTKSIVLGMLVNIVLNFFFIFKFKSIGVAIASVIAEFIISAIQFYYIRNDFDLKYIFRSSRNYLLASFCMLVLLVVEEYLLSSSFINTCIMIVTGSSTYFLILFFVKDDFFIENAYKIVSKNNITNKYFRKLLNEREL